MNTVHLITPCSRPENLTDIFAAIKACDTPYHWHIVFDAEVPLPSEPPGEPSAPAPLVLEFARSTYEWHPSRGRGAWGNPQRNRALDQVDANSAPGDTVYFCDDDNIPHPGLFRRALQFQTHGPKLVIVNQIRRDGSVRLRVNHDIVLCGIDTAQAFIPHAFIGELRWDAFPNPADYHFLRALWERHRADFVFLDENLSYYNYLRLNGPP